MVQSPSWEANWFAASQEISRISRNPKVHYRTHKRPPPVPILGQPNRVHIPTSHLLEIHPNIIHPSTPRSPHWSLSLRFPHQDPIRPPLLTHTRHMPCPSHSSRFYHPHNIGWGVQITVSSGLECNCNWGKKGRVLCYSWGFRRCIETLVMVILCNVINVRLLNCDESGRVLNVWFRLRLKTGIV